MQTSQAKCQNENYFHLWGFMFFPRIAVFSKDVTFSILIYVRSLFPTQLIFFRGQYKLQQQNYFLVMEIRCSGKRMCSALNVMNLDCADTFSLCKLLKVALQIILRCHRTEIFISISHSLVLLHVIFLVWFDLLFYGFFWGFFGVGLWFGVFTIKQLGFNFFFFPGSATFFACLRDKF